MIMVITQTISPLNLNINPPNHVIIRGYHMAVFI